MNSEYQTSQRPSGLMEKAELQSLGLWVQAPPRCVWTAAQILQLFVFKKTTTHEYNPSKRPSGLIDAAFRAGVVGLRLTLVMFAVLQKHLW